MKNAVLVILIFVYLTTVSCEIACRTPGMYAHFSGFDSVEVALVVVKEFPPNGSFSGAVDTIVYSSALSTAYYAPQGDTVAFYNYPFAHTFGLRSGYDCEIDIPATGEVYKVSGISFGKEKTANKRDGCTSSTVCYVNGKLQHSPSTNEDYDDVSIQIQK